MDQKARYTASKNLCSQVQVTPEHEFTVNGARLDLTIVGHVMRNGPLSGPIAAKRIVRAVLPASGEAFEFMYVPLTSTTVETVSVNQGEWIVRYSGRRVISERFEYPDWYENDRFTWKDKPRLSQLAEFGNIVATS